MAKQEELNKLRRMIEADINLPLFGQANLVLGEGNIDCEVLFIGEAPGKEEDKLIRPFVGRSGQLLNKMLEGLGWKREQVYITNIVKRRPPDNRDPLPSEIEAYKPYLAKQIEIIKPKIIATLGRFSMNYFLPDNKITRDQGKIFKSGTYKIFPLFHPAAILRGTVKMTEYETSFKNLKNSLENLGSEFGPF